MWASLTPSPATADTFHWTYDASLPLFCFSSAKSVRRCYLAESECLLEYLPLLSNPVFYLANPLLSGDDDTMALYLYFAAVVGIEDADGERCV